MLSTQNNYLQFLSNAYKQVVNATLQDQSINVLSEMDNKDYYFKRINELFIQIYSAQREDKIKQLLHTVEQLTKEKEESALKTDKQYICEKCLKVDENSECDQIQYNVNLALKQNHELANELEKVKQTELSKIKTISQIHEVAQEQMKQQIDQLSRKSIQMTKKYKQLKDTYVNQIKKVQELSCELVNQKQKVYQIEIKCKIIQKQKQQCENGVQKLQSQIQNLQQCKNILQQKNRRLQNNTNFQKQKLQAYEKQIRRINDNAKNIPNIDIKNPQQHRQDKYKQQNLTNLISNLTLKQLQLTKIKKDKDNLIHQNTTLSRQLTQCKISSDKSIMQLKQNLNKTTIQYQRQLKTYRQKQKQGILEIRQTELTSKLSQLNTLKQQLKSLQQQKFQLSNTVLKVEHSNKVLTRNYQQLANTLKHVQTQYEEKIKEYEDKLQNYRKMEKQLSKRIKMKQDGEFKIVQEQLRQKIKYYQSIVQQTASQLQTHKKSQQKLSRELQLIERQNKRSNLNQTNKTLMLRQHELVIKVNDLQNSIQQHKMVSKQMMDKKQEKIKSLKKQLHAKQDQVIQLNVMYQRQNKQKQHHQKSQKQLQKQLRIQQQKLLQIQQMNRNQILQLIKMHDNQIQQLNKQCQKYHSNFCKNNNNTADKSHINSSLKNLQKQYYDQINNLSTQWSELKNNNITMQNKYKQVQKTFKQCNLKLEKVSSQLESQKNKSFALQENLQKYKNKQVRIVKFYEGKINGFKCMFNEFKHQICHQFKQAVMQLRTQVYQIKKTTLKTSQQYKKLMISDKHEAAQQIYLYHNLQLKAYELQNNKTSQLTLTKLQKQKQQLKVNYQLKLKQKQIDMMSMIAQKQFVIQQMKSNQIILSKKNKDVETGYQKMVIKLQKVQKVQKQLKQIIQKMQNKVDDAQKSLLMKQKQAKYLQKSLQQTKQILKKLQNQHKKQLTQYKQKYRQQNQKIFNRFQRQFTKITNLNTKKNKQVTNIGGVGNRKYQIPTKGNQQDRIVKLKKQILQQKKIVSQLQSKNKY